MAMNSKGRSNQSLCEKSLKMVTNIVRLSSFSIAEMSLGGATAAPPPPAKNIPASPGSAKVPSSPPLLPQFPISIRRAQEPKSSSSKPVSYLIEPVEGDGSLRVIHEEKSVDEKVSDYIRRVHAKNRNDSSEAKTLSAYVLPPPPHVLM